MERIVEAINDSICLKQKVLTDQVLIEGIAAAAQLMVDCFKQGGKVLFCGNGGSAADAQHLAAELSGRFYYDREPLYAEALHVNSSYLTAVANDYSYDEIYARMVKAQGRTADVLVGISTSGNSENVYRAMVQAKVQGMTTVALTGVGGGKMKEVSDVLLSVPSVDTPRVQEVHITIGHVICELIEKSVFPTE